MKAMVTRFEKEKAQPYGNLIFTDLCPEAFREGNVFHSVYMAPNAVLDPECNLVNKAFFIFDGSCEAEVDGEVFSLTRGDVLWLPKGSTHVIRNGTGDLFFTTVKKET